MNKKLHHFFTIYIEICVAAVVFLLCATSVFSLEITEINYDLEGSDSVLPSEWIEIYNDSISEIEIEKVKFLESGSYHNINEYGSSGIVIPVGAYVIVAHRADLFFDFYPTFSGLVFDSSFSLLNTGETLKLTDDNQVELDSFTYSSADGAAGDGNTLHKNGTVIVSGIPTPGETYQQSQIQESAPETDTSTSSSTTQSLKTTYEIVVEGNLFTGVVNNFFVRAKKGTQTMIPSVHWNFGDTNTTEGSEVFYFYEKPGTYHITASDKKTEDVITTLVVVITEPTIKIEKNGKEHKLTNMSNSSINVSKWSVADRNTTLFVFPKHSILLRNQSITLPIKTDSLYLSIKNQFNKKIIEKDFSVIQNTIKEPKKIIKTEKKIVNPKENTQKNKREDKKITEEKEVPFKDKKINLTLTKENFWIWILVVFLLSILIISPLLFETYKKNKK